MHPAASFRRDGYLLVRELFGPDEVRLLRDACDSALDRAPPLPRPGRARSPARTGSDAGALRRGTRYQLWVSDRGCQARLPTGLQPQRGGQPTGA